MANVRRPRKGSLQFWPRVRAKRIYPRVRKWFQLSRINSLGFAGYKVGMTHVQFVDDAPHSLTKGDVVTMPVTVIECPPLKVFGLRFYTSSVYGSSVSDSLFAQKLDKVLGRKIVLPKRYDFDKKLKELEGKINDFSNIRLLVHTQPRLIKMKRTPEIFELGIGGDNINNKYKYAKEFLGGELNIKDIFDSGVMVDVHSVTKGKGFQGSIKRFGIGLRGHKSEKKRRAVGNVGAWTPKKVSWTVGLPGQHGFHTRTEMNKELVLVNDRFEDINPKSGFKGYGIVRGSYVLLKGSVPGPAKRLVILTNAKRGRKTVQRSLRFIRR